MLSVSGCAGKIIYGSEGVTVLGQACRHGNLQCVEMLIEAGSVSECWREEVNAAGRE